MLDTTTLPIRHLIVNQTVIEDKVILNTQFISLNDIKDIKDIKDINIIHNLHIHIQGDCEFKTLASSIELIIDKVATIAINFSKVVDGRGYSLAYLIRNRLKFKGELRAVGDFTRDQLYFLSRTGFNAMTLRVNEDPYASLSAFKTFSQPYQGSQDMAIPLFKRVHRHG